MTSVREEAADLIWRHWQAGTVADDLPDALKPATRADGYAIQACLERYSKEPRAGWKIAATSIGGQRHINVDGPLAGRLLAEQLHDAGSTLSLAGNRMRVAEPEIAFRFGNALAPRERRYGTAEVMAAVSDLHLAIELPDSRFADCTAVGGATLIADNACARDLVLGPAVAVDWRGLDLSAHRVEARVGGRNGGRYARTGSGAAVLGDPRTALTWLVNEVCGLGITVEAGEIVTTGVCMEPLDILPGERVEADFGSLGRVDVTLAS